MKRSLECGRTCNAKAAAIVGEVLAMRLKVEGLDQGQGNGIHVNVNKENSALILLSHTHKVQKTSLPRVEEDGSDS
ncbi:hypothetical protein K7X08_025521 [Anisodus acutangulus]|uniref:Uncharacterized protein n=1 Tax=Anisodus acutangulus TaxID=402998 RepID=A0A9Q1R5W5_9SOLA|nr:hypothetical protein K7X08_025521 [Anisodus acutangulus]